MKIKSKIYKKKKYKLIMSTYELGLLKNFINNLKEEGDYGINLRQGEAVNKNQTWKVLNYISNYQI